ncbi:helix-turn-helix domain-containing protein [Bacillus cereus]|uniref:helix-turn-helix domain-containing protein n=1 Tax=Bacillus cereus TaxID=1396 RepID=UPI0020111565|nr:helix-turn-helix domain-containing protein [Bacillus cereus]
MKRAYLIEIKPTTEQISKIRQTIGVCRYVYNLYISKTKRKCRRMKTYEKSIFNRNQTDN